MNHYSSQITFFWFRRDLRLDDNTALNHALRSGLPVIPLFIFDEDIIQQLPRDDARITFIYDTLAGVNNKLLKMSSSLLIKKGKPLEVWQSLVQCYEIARVYFNCDYEPYARKRDKKVCDWLKSRGIICRTFKDQVIFEPHEVLKKDQTPYKIYTPYKNKWLQHLQNQQGFKTIDEVDSYWRAFSKQRFVFPALSDVGFHRSGIKVKRYNFSQLGNYHLTRDHPDLDGTSYLAPYLRFGLVSIRKIVSFALKTNTIFLNELIWRAFFMQILYHFPYVINHCFKQKYDALSWRDAPKDFESWCKGKTGYPLVDAGMRQLNATGYMHNRVRMVAASFLCKHLLIDWRLGAHYFSLKLLDFDLASNNGNWQWAASTGADAVPYFRIFNPTTQLESFDKQKRYIKKWVRDVHLASYPDPIVEHRFARDRAIEAYKAVL